MLFLLPTPLGNLGDITLRSLEVLSSCEVLLCEDTRVSKKLLSLLSGIPCVAKNYPGLLRKKIYHPFHSHNEEAFLSNIERLGIDFSSQDVAFMSDSGMPCISDPGSRLVAYAQKHGLGYEVLPGGSAPSLAYAMSGFDAQGFIFGGFLPHKIESKREMLEEFFSLAITSKRLALVFFESPHRILNSVKEIALMYPDSEVFAVKEMTKIYQKSFKCYSRDLFKILLNENIQGEWVLVFLPPVLQKKSLSVIEIEQMNLPPKIQAKLIAKITKQDVKSVYEKIIQSF